MSMGCQSDGGNAQICKGQNKAKRNIWLENPDLSSEELMGKKNLFCEANTVFVLFFFFLLVVGR